MDSGRAEAWSGSNTIKRYPVPNADHTTIPSRHCRSGLLFYAQLSHFQHPITHIQSILSNIQLKNGANDGRIAESRPIARLTAALFHRKRLQGDRPSPAAFDRMNFHLFFLQNQRRCVKWAKVLMMIFATDSLSHYG